MVKGISKLSIRKQNKQCILKLLKKKGQLSRSQIASEISLTKASITGLIGEMIEAGLVLEVDSPQDNPSLVRRNIKLEINPDFGVVIGCMINLDYIYVGAANIQGEVLTSLPRVKMENTQLDWILGTVNSLVKETEANLEDKSILGIGMGISNDVIQMLGEQTKLFKDINEKVSAATGHKVVICKGTDALATAQLDYGKDDDVQNMVYIQVADKMDISIVIGGEIYKGAHNRVGNMSHVVVDPNGPLCSCGKRGCVNKLISVNYVIEKVTSMYSKENFPILYELTGGNASLTTYDTLITAGIRGDQLAKKIYDEAEELFTNMLFNIINILDPQKCYIHGIGAYAKEYIHEKNTLARERLDDCYSNVFELSMFNNYREFLAGCAIATGEFFFKELGQQTDNSL